MLLTNILEKSAKRYPDKTTLTMRMGYRQVSFRYRDVYDLSVKIALFLEHRGLKKNDKVLLCAANSPYWVAVFFGCQLRGFIPVPLNIQSTSELVKKIAAQTEAKVIFKDRHFQEKLPAGIMVYEIEFIKELVEAYTVPHFQKTPLAEEDIAEIMYTSGTTGDPKGVLLTHKNICSNLKALAAIAHISSRTDKFLSILPLSHIFEQVAGFLLPFSEGVPIIYAHSRPAIRDLLKEHRVTIMAGVPEFLRIVMARIESRLPRNTLPFVSAVPIRFLRRCIFWPVLHKFGGKLHTVISGGAPLDPELEKKWNALGIYLLQGYGLTETSPVLSTNTYADRRLGSVGKVLSGVEIKIAPNGEILAQGPNVFQGYFKNEEKTREAFTKDGWFKTDDVGYLDNDGFLFLRGRKKYMIKGPGAQNVYPEDVEFALNNVSGVKDSCVVGVEKTGGNVEIHAVLLMDQETAPQQKPEDIIARANKKLASFQRITGWSVWTAADFPRSATRKVKKEEVLKWLKEKKSLPLEAFAKERTTPLIRLLAEITGTPLTHITQHTKIVPELHLDSLLRVELVARIEEELGTVIDEAKIVPATTVADLEQWMKVGVEPATLWRLKHWPRSPLVSTLRSALQALILFPLFKIFVRLKIEGKENLAHLPLPVILMPNHISYLDSMVIIMSLPRRIRKRVAFAAAADVLYGLYKRWSTLAELLFNAFPFPRHEQENIKFGLDYMGKLLDTHWSVIIYPEGKMSLTGDLLPLKRGAGLIAVAMDASIVPVKISGTQKILPPGRFMPKKRGEAVVTFGAPMQFKKSESYIAATEEIEKVLAKLY